MQYVASTRTCPRGSFGQTHSFSSQELYADIQSLFLPEMLSTMLKTLYCHMDTVSLEDVTQSLRACFKVLSKIQMPVAYMDVDAMTQLEETQLPEDESKKTQVWLFALYASITYLSVIVLVFNFANSLIILYRTWPMARFMVLTKEG